MNDPARQPRQHQGTGKVAAAPNAAVSCRAPCIAAAPRAFYRRRDWLTFGVAALAALGLYVATLAPSVTMEDSGEFIVAADHLGVPHPPGYPVWTMIAWFFARVFSFVTLRGQPNPAWAVNLVSAVCGALTIGALAMLIARSGRDLLRHSTAYDETSADPWRRRYSSLAAVAASLLFACTHTMWSQAVIAEIYTLNALFLALMLLFTYQWMRKPTDRHLLLTAFVFGLSLANYYTLLLIVLPLAVILLLNDTRLCRDFAIAALPYVILLLLAKYMHVTPGVLLGQDAAVPVTRHLLHPAGINFQVYLFLNFLILTAVWFLLPRGRTVAGGILAAQLGFAFYLYMPLASDLRNPPMNWGYARTWHGFLHAVGREQYGQFEVANIFSMRFVDQLGDYLADLRMQFSLPAALLGFLPFAAWEFRIGRRRLRAFGVAVALAGLGTALAVIEEYALAPRSVGGGPGLYKLALAPTLILALLGVGILLIGQMRKIFDRLRAPLAQTPVSEKIVLAAAPLALLALLIALASGMVGNIAGLMQTLRVPGAEREEGELAWILIQAGGMISLLLLPMVLSFLIVRMMNSQYRLRMTINPSGQRWIVALLCGFAALSVIVIVMANPKGDIQDAFVQKVKFISSHAIFGIWIGYGALLLLSYARSVTTRRPLCRRAACALIALMPLIPLRQNWSHKRMVEMYGGAEQNGHDFGWQFGHYPLRGAEAVLEELRPDEEPPPNPQYPAAMAPDAFFYGGTDPGRFVPTYMILSARVREDVFLVTQNALANETYRSEMRDLYGDRVWMPSEAETRDILSRYIEAVLDGREPRPPEEHLVITREGMRPQNVQGIMIVNGVLARAIFERNRDRHPFYVEESFPLPWMYPYMQPHGLVMRLHATPARLTPEMTDNDLDFWDWYTRRLTADEAYLRDFAARRGFSSLRASLANLYVSRGRMPEAETAYQEARLLHPFSYEAIFRFVHGVLLPADRFDEARRVLETLGRGDPYNRRIPPVMAQLEHRRQTLDRMAQLEDELRHQPQSDPGRALELGRLYLALGRQEAFLSLARRMLDRPPPEPMFQVHFQLAAMYSGIGRVEEAAEALALARRSLPPDLDPRYFGHIIRMYSQAGRTEDVAWAIEAYLKQRPDDFRAWLDLAATRIKLKAPAAEIRQALSQALVHGGQEARTIVMQAAEFAPYARALRPAPPHLP
jgi:tetratricopeptide (TPR) repeat protein